MGKENFDEQVQLLQAGKIDFLQFIMNGEYAHDFLNWCDDHGLEPLADNAEFYYEMISARVMESQYSDTAIL